MIRGRALFASSAIASAFLVGACALVIGIDKRPIEQLDAGAGADGGDGCRHRLPPPETRADDESRSLPQLVLAVRETSLGERSRFDDEPIGYDLDDRCTCFPDAAPGPGLCRRADAGAEPEPICDLADGVDNATAQVRFLIGAEDKGASSFDNEFKCGRNGFLIVVEGYNGRANDASIVVGLVPSVGIRTEHEPGEAPACPGKDAGVVTYAPRWNGTDEWASDTRSIVTGGRRPQEMLRGYVSDWRLVVKLPATAKARIPLGPIAPEASEGVLVATVIPLDLQRNELERKADTRADLIKLVGQLAGRVSVSHVLSSIALIKRNDLGDLCPGNVIFDTLRTQLCAQADLPASAADDGRDKNCDAISAAMAFKAEPAQIAPSRGDGPVPEANPCEAGPPPACSY